MLLIDFLIIRLLERIAHSSRVIMGELGDGNTDMAGVRIWIRVRVIMTEMGVTGYSQMRSRDGRNVNWATGHKGHIRGTTTGTKGTQMVQGTLNGHERHKGHSRGTRGTKRLQGALKGHEGH